MEKKLENKRTTSAEKYSHRIFLLLVGVSVGIFLLFFLVGYDRPFATNPNFKAPVLTDVFLALVYLLLVLSTVVIGWSVWRRLKVGSSSPAVVNNIPTRRIAIGVTVATAVVLLLTFFCASTQPMMVAGERHANAFWLRVADMFVLSIPLMLFLAAAALIFGLTRSQRRGRKTMR